MNCSNNSGKILAAMVAGIGIGGVLGILYAPAKGSETRNRLHCKAEETDSLTESLKTKFNDLIAEIRKDVEDAKSNHNNLV